MGQKVDPHALRLGINKNWSSQYFPSQKRFEAEYLKQDKLIRDYVNLISRDILSIRIERSSSNLLVFITTSNISYLTEKNNERLEKIINSIQKISKKEKNFVTTHLIEEKKVFCNAKFIANLIASKIKARTPFRVAIRSVISKMNLYKEIKGLKIKVSGRLDGSEIAKTEKFNIGKIPLSFLTGNFDFAKSEAMASYGVIGVTVWLYKGRKNFFKIPFENFKEQKIRDKKRFNYFHANTKEN